MTEANTVPPKKRTSWKDALWLFRWLKPYRLRFAAGLFFLLLTSVTALAFPRLMGMLVETAEASLPEAVNRAALLLLILFVLQAFFSFMRIYLFVNVTERMLAALRQDTYNILITKPMAFFSHSRVGELNSRLASDTAQLQDTFTTGIAEFLRQFIIIAGGIALLAWTSSELTLVMLGVIPPVAVATLLFGRFIRRLSREVQDELAASNTIVEETLQGIASVKAFTNELFESARYRSRTERVVEKAMKGAVWRAAFASFIIFCLFGSIVLIIWYGVGMVQEGRLSMGLMIQFVLYTVFVGASTGGIAEQYAQIQKAVGATESLKQLREGVREETMGDAREAAVVSGEIRFREVTFAYPSRKEITVLNGVSFEAGAGEKVAIVGPSGAGKSTITALLLRFYTPDRGAVLIDGRDVTSYPLAALRRCMAVVPQEVLLFGGTIRENIGYGKPGASMEEITAAAKKANAYDFIESFPEKFDTVVGERGIQLSGGQRQRIAIARAVLKDPSILILDEATSSLDSESERLVQDALEKLMEGRTSVIIAHRLSTIRHADKIIVLDKGRVVETGSHEELIGRREGLYANLSRLQFEV